MRGLSPGEASEESHVYPIYSNMRLIKLVDCQPVISAILLFQPRVVDAAVQGGAARVVIADLIHNELVHAQSKLGNLSGKVDSIEDDATAMERPEGDVAANVKFFLLHELPHDLKAQALSEAGRMLAPGGKLYLAEFHRPELWVLRALSWTYFKVFEPLGLALWDTHDPLDCLEKMGGWACERSTHFFGNFQIITATKQ
ncbi:MAG: methyltransferase domain-containing protein [Betaproteobacteria bacterium]|nr:methyltransferase domain-containing protein [Betaproteobacteria bacterium]